MTVPVRGGTRLHSSTAGGFTSSALGGRLMCVNRKRLRPKRTQMIFNKKMEDSRNLATTVEPVAAAKLDILRHGQPRNSLPQQAHINSGLTIKGDLKTDGELQIDGQILGNVSCGHLVIGKDGAVRGDIKADEAVIRGKTNGVIRARRVMLQESARVVGDIFHERMSMEEGAQFIGASNPGKEEAAEQIE
jgi:cytoskeletal protein CcmA (bactofilin family)